MLVSEDGRDGGHETLFAPLRTNSHGERASLILELAI